MVSKKTAAAAAGGVAIAALVIGAAALRGQPPPPPPPPPGPLTGQQSFANVFASGTSFFVDVGINVSGGTQPYTYEMTWSDFVLQGPQISNAIFTRSFTGAVTVSGGTVTVTDNANAKINVSVKVPFP